MKHIDIRCQRWHFVLFILLTTAACDSGVTFAQTSPQTNNDDDKLKVMTWNLEWFYDEYDGDNFSKLAKEKTSPSRAEWDWHRDAVADSISQAKPTILALQEVENRRVLWYLSRALDRNHKLDYHELCDQSTDHFTEQDVGLMFRTPADAISTTHYRMTQRLRKTKQYFDLSKHIQGTFDFPVGDGRTERVVVMNIHWRSRAEGEPIRIRQARLTNHWIANLIQSGQNVILLGDTNTEERGDTTRPDSDLGIACGLQTVSKEDDLVDLHLKLPRNQRRTHLLPDRQFDRIMVSKSLMEDDPSRRDLVFSDVKVLSQLTIREGQDTEQEHWENYWSMPQSKRDLSDHYPVMATFEVK